MNKHGLIIGKFYPPHEGHHYLIDTALSECENVTVVILANPVEKLDMSARALMIEDRHPSNRLRVLSTVDRLPVDYDDPEMDLAHAKVVWDEIGGTYGRKLERGYDLPITLYTSEEYGDNFAAALQHVVRGCDDWTEVPEKDRDSWERYFSVTHRMVDLKRIAKPVSATAIRRDMVGHWDSLAPGTKSALCKKVVICGGESTGTTTLTKALAERYQTVWVPEWGRLFSEATGEHHKWTSDDFGTIIDEQNKLRTLLSRSSGPVMFCDTDGIATCMFHELYMKRPAPEEQWRRALNWSRDVKLYVITDDTGVAFEDDGYRLFPQQRAWATQWFIDKLSETGKKVLIARGTHEERMDKITAAIDCSVLHWDFPVAEEKGKKSVVA